MPFGGHDASTLLTCRLRRVNLAPSSGVAPKLLVATRLADSRKAAWVILVRREAGDVSDGQRGRRLFCSDYGQEFLALSQDMFDAICPRT
jgi:hypothetical protein